MARIAVDEVVLAAVGLVGDDHDVAPVRQQRMPVALPFRARGSPLALPGRGLLGEELLDRREHHAAGLDRELRPQIGAALRLDRRLPQQVGAAREGREQLIVEVVAIGQHDDGGVLHRGLPDDASRVERHRQALARPLGVPDHADPPVASRAARLAARLVAALRVAIGDRLLQCGRAQRFSDGGLHGVELVVPRHLLHQVPAAVVLEHDEVAHQRQQPAPGEDTFEQHLKLRQARVGQRLARDRAPRLAPLAAGRQRPDPRLQAVRDDERGVEDEQRRDLRLVGLKLLERRPDRGVLVHGVLQLDDGQRQPVDEQHDVGPALVPALDHGELIDCEPVVPVRFVEVDHANLSAANPAVRVDVLHGDAGDKHAMEVAVSGLQRHTGRAGQSAQGVIECVGGQVGIEPAERGPQAQVQHDLAIVRAFGGRHALGDVRTVSDGPTERCQPVEPDGFDGRFRQRFVCSRTRFLDRHALPDRWKGALSVSRCRLACIHPQPSGDQLGEERVAQCGEGSGFFSALLSEVKARTRRHSRIPHPGEDTAGCHHLQKPRQCECRHTLTSTGPAHVGWTANSL